MESKKDWNQPHNENILQTLRGWGFSHKVVGVSVCEDGFVNTQIANTVTFMA